MSRLATVQAQTKLKASLFFLNREGANTASSVDLHRAGDRS
jgi:hypothetical protein